MSSEVLVSLQCSSLSDDTVTCPPTLHLITPVGCHCCLALDPSGGPSSLCLRLLFARRGCRRVFLMVLTAAASLREFWALSRVLSFLGSGPCLECVPLLEAPHRSCSPIPSLAPSWWGPCPLLWRALLTLSCHVLSVPSAFSLRCYRL